MIVLSPSCSCTIAECSRLSAVVITSALWTVPWKAISFSMLAYDS